MTIVSKDGIKQALATVPFSAKAYWYLLDLGGPTLHFRGLNSLERLRGMLPEWLYCPWCYGPGYEPTRRTRTPGTRYPARCTACLGPMLRFMRYCPWCRAKVKKPWIVRPFPEVCCSCDWPVDSQYWRFCPWCCDSLY